MVNIDKTLKENPMMIDCRSLPKESAAMFAPVPDQPLYQSEKSPINAHYKQFNIEACDVIDDWKLNFNLGSVIKYIARCDFKDDRLQDLQKAHDYLTREIANEKKFRKEVGV